MIAPICFSTFIRYHISADHRSLPTAHHEEVCDYYEQRRELPLPVYHKSANKSALYTPFSNIFLKLSFTAATSSDDKNPIDKL